MPIEELTFEAIDDLIAAYARGKLGPPASGMRFAASSVAPLVELAYSSVRARPNLLVTSAWLDAAVQADLLVALRSSQTLWFDAVEQRGFMRTVYDPIDTNDLVQRARFLMAARKSAEAAG